MLGGQRVAHRANLPAARSPANDAPNATDDTLTVAEDAAPTPVPVLGNDNDVDGDTRTISAKTDGAKGVVVITGGGTGLTYKPDLNTNGSDSFTYTVDDGHGATDTATVNVTITPVNDKPDARNDPGFSVQQGSGATPLTVLTNDVDADLDALQITANTNGRGARRRELGCGAAALMTAIVPRLRCERHVDQSPDLIPVFSISSVRCSKSSGPRSSTSES